MNGEQGTTQRQSRHDVVTKSYDNIIESVIDLEHLCDRLVGPEPPKPTPENIKTQPDPQNIAFMLDMLPKRLTAVRCRLENVRKRLDSALL